MVPLLSFDRLRSILVSTVRDLPDPRTRPNRIYEMADAALGAFAVFWMQADSFLAYQQAMQQRGPAPRVPHHEHRGDQRLTKMSWTGFSGFLKS